MLLYYKFQYLWLPKQCLHLCLSFIFPLLACKAKIFTTFQICYRYASRDCGYDDDKAVDIYLIVCKWEVSLGVLRLCKNIYEYLVWYSR